ncbi:SDR family NAD(P)-dependent oxidoreductase [Staphylococcus sp. 11007852]|nr:SDR family NAD(P)-dependent oxidoreductase [Staphylococcus sp. 11007852]NJH83439.1 SDR family NAD(P)-dependent oxidoreductase [Staphylococcus agnetis]
MMNKHFVVTGGTSGLGLEIVRNLLHNNVKVTLLARDINKCKTLFNEDGHYKIFTEKQSSKSGEHSSICL